MRPILFSPPMVEAILEGRKTMTRRVWAPGRRPSEYDGMYMWSLPTDDPSGPVKYAWGALETPRYPPCKFGKVGDRLWVKEALVKWGEITRYKVDGALAAGGRKWEWKNPVLHGMYMPRWAARLFLEIVSVRLERVQDISEADAQREGWDWSNHDLTKRYDPATMNTARQWFEVLWDKLNGKEHPWSSNPWVWVIEFKRTEVVDAK